MSVANMHVRETHSPPRVPKSSDIPIGHREIGYKDYLQTNVRCYLGSW